MGEVVERCLGRVSSIFEEFCVTVVWSFHRFDRREARSVRSPMTMWIPCLKGGNRNRECRLVVVEVMSNVSMSWRSRCYWRSSETSLSAQLCLSVWRGFFRERSVRAERDAIVEARLSQRDFGLRHKSFFLHGAHGSREHQTIYSEMARLHGLILKQSIRRACVAVSENRPYAHITTCLKEMRI